MRRRARPLLLLFAVLILPAADALAHRGHSTQAPWTACSGRQLGAECAWTDASHAVYAGSCRQIGGGLMCVRNQPIARARPPADATTPVTYRWFTTALARITHRP